MLQFGFDDRPQRCQRHRPVEALSIDKQRGCGVDANLFTVRDILVHGALDLYRAEVGLEPVYIQAYGPCETDNALSRQAPLLRKQGVIHSPELALLVRGERCRGRKRGLGMAVERELL